MNRSFSGADGSLCILWTAGAQRNSLTANAHVSIDTLRNSLTANAHVSVDTLRPYAAWLVAGVLLQVIEYLRMPKHEQERMDAEEY